MSSSFSKRLIYELKVYESQKQFLNDQGIYLEYDHHDLTQLKLLIIGPSNTPYYGGFYFFYINIPNNYPFIPPIIKFVTKYNNIRFHPNLYVDGNVCLSILNTWGKKEWSPCMTIVSIASTLQSILNNNPLTNEPSYENAIGLNAQNYKKIVNYNNLMGGVIEMIKNIPIGFSIFQHIINNYFINHFNEYLIYIENDGEIITCTEYSITCKLDYKKVKNEFDILISILKKEG
jgi:ubiquitin-protein ligase